MTIVRLFCTAAVLACVMFSAPVFAQDAGAGKGMMMRQKHMEDVLSQLPPEKSKLFKDMMKQVREKNDVTYTQIKKLQKEKDAILTADTFDKNMYLAKLVELDKLYDQMRENRNAAFISVASQFSPAERKILAKSREPMSPPPEAEGAKPVESK